MSNNFMRSKCHLVIEHKGLADKQLHKILVKAVKNIRGRSQRHASIECGGIYADTEDKDTL